jgi:hypothetical protein
LDDAAPQALLGDRDHQAVDHQQADGRERSSEAEEKDRRRRWNADDRQVDIAPYPRVDLHDDEGGRQEHDAADPRQPPAGAAHHRPQRAAERNRRAGRVANRDGDQECVADRHCEHVVDDGRADDRQPRGDDASSDVLRQHDDHDQAESYARTSDRLLHRPRVGCNVRPGDGRTVWRGTGRS